MDLRKLKKLIDLVEESGIAELEITEGEEKVRIAKSGLIGTVPLAQVAPMPAPAPVPHKVTLKAGVLFHFDKASLTPADRAKLDDLSRKMSALTVEVVVATGHTDPIGSSAYNQKLSVRRADSVKAFLMSKGLDSDRIYAEGRGETQQVKACSKSMSRAARIKCLAPNRRVEIEVIGTQSN